MSIAEIKGTTVNAKLWIPVEEVESSALDQLRNAAGLPWAAHVLAMPDVHTGIGATVGSVLALRGAVPPSAVGVDPGCVDMDTEYLSPAGWVKISQYSDGLVMQYDPKTGYATPVRPTRFIRLPCKSFLRFETKYGVDQALSDEHRVLFAKYTRDYKFDRLETWTAGEVAERHNSRVLGFRGRFLTTFTVDPDTHIPASDAELRVAVMLAADGHLDNRRPGSTCWYATFKKYRKIMRTRMLLNAAKISYSESAYEYATVFRFNFPSWFAEKSFSGIWWTASAKQLAVIFSEYLHWDGNTADRVYFTGDKASADFISYVVAACGCRSVMRTDPPRKPGYLPEYRVFAHSNTKVGICSGSVHRRVEQMTSRDGLKYCFSVPSGYWIMRRNGIIAITGNCGLNAIPTNLQRGDLPKSTLEAHYHQLKRSIPTGFYSHRDAAWGSWVQMKLIDQIEGLESRFARLSTPNLRLEKFRLQLGTLGGGNHFLELTYDATGRVWIVVHSGSRRLGLDIAIHHTQIAKSFSHNAQLRDRDLAVLLDGTDEMAAYEHDLQWALDYALANRMLMVELALRALKAERDGTEVACHHNYWRRETHFGEELFVTRKGAIHAAAGQLGVIPGAMGRSTYIVRGKGSAEALESASHGAGRRMSRGDAKRRFSPEAVQQMLGDKLVCPRPKNVIDECPEAYKNIDQVMAWQSDLVEVVEELKPLLCMKGE